MKRVINVQITRGEQYYIAESLDLPIVTQGKSLDELIANIREAIELALEDGDAERLGVVQNPSIVANIIVDSPEYA
jgi:predicted RNase H-like HicB family nuclease